jgi:hypothetical protein
LEASGGGSEGEAGAEKRRSPSRSSSPAEGEEAGMEGDREEKRPRKRSAGGERRGLPAASIGVLTRRAGADQEVVAMGYASEPCERGGLLRHSFAGPWRELWGHFMLKNIFRVASEGKQVGRISRNNYSI